MNYYLLSFTANGATTPAYYGILLTSSGTFEETGAEIFASTPGKSTVTGTEAVLTISTQAGSLTGSASLATTAKSVAGQVQVNPAINTDVVVTLSGMTQIAQYVLPAGKTSGSFSFAVNDDQALSKDLAASRFEPAESGDR